ncbi:MAG: DivIVA domain-containing protein [Bacteroidota bacterium]
MLDPLQIRNQEFTSAFRGVNEEEVRNYLREVARQWEELLNENRRLEQRTTELNEKLAHYLRIEEALQEAVQSARENARRTQETAEQRAKLTIEEAEMRAQQLVQDAEHERYLAKQDLAKLNNRLSEVTARLRAFHTSELEILAAFTGEEPTAYFPRVQAAERRALPAAGSGLVGDAPAAVTPPSAEDPAERPTPALRPPAESTPASTTETVPKRTVDFRSLFASPEPKTAAASATPMPTAAQRESELEKAKIRRILEDLD